MQVFAGDTAFLTQLSDDHVVFTRNFQFGTFTCQIDLAVLDVDVVVGKSQLGRLARQRDFCIGQIEHTFATGSLLTVRGIGIDD